MESKKVTSKKAKTSKDKSSSLAENTSSTNQTTAPRSAKISPKNTEISDTASAKRHRKVAKTAEATAGRSAGANTARSVPEKAMAAAAAQEASHFSAPIAALDSGDAVAVTAAVPNTFVSQEEIARLAYSYWEQRGYGHGNSQDDWHRAEQALKANP